MATHLTPNPDQPLPDKLINEKTSWSTQAQRYPVFSQTWFRYRARSYLLPLGIFTALLCAFGLLIAREPSKDGTEPTALHIFYLWLTVVTCMLLGRFLATQVRRRRWTQSVEKTAIVIAIITGITTSFLISHLPDNRPKKNLDASRTSQQHKPGTPSKNGEAKISLYSVDDKQNETTIIDIILWIVLLSWGGGLLDLRTYFKQTRDLSQALTQEQLEKYKNERNQAQMQLSILASQVEPHFLFNTLSGVRAAMLSDPARGVQIIDHLVDYLRATIPQMRSDGSLMFSTVEQQFHAIRAYLGVIQTRLPRLQVSVECPPELKQYTMPPLMLISLVENAVKHGIEPKKGEVTISVSAHHENTGQDEKLIISVVDNGVGFGHTTSGTGIGLSNIRERLKQLYGDQASLQLTTRETGGVNAALHLPLQ